jgi:hypothetical protein
MPDITRARILMRIALLRNLPHVSRLYANSQFEHGASDDDEKRKHADNEPAWNDTARRERLREELDFVTAELSRAVGLGGRTRRATSALERARVNVRRRIALALRQVEKCSLPIGRHLSDCVRTGVHCVYSYGGTSS